MNEIKQTSSQKDTQVAYQTINKSPGRTANLSKLEASKNPKTQNRTNQPNLNPRKTPKLQTEQFNQT
jgi:hypothetical protein